MSRYRRRIGIDARFMLRPLRGIPLYVTRLCEYLPALDRDSLFYLFINRAYEHNDRVENYQPRIDAIVKAHPNVRVVNRDFDAEIAWEQLYLPRLIKEHRIDLLFMPGNRICFRPGIPTVVTVHDVMEHLFLNRGYFRNLLSADCGLRMKLYRLRTAAYVSANYRIGFRGAARIVTVSDYSSADIVRNLGIPKGKVTAIHHGLDGGFAPGPPLPERNYVLMLGGDSYQKNSEGALAAWALVDPELRRRYPLKIIGFCGREDSPLLAALERHGLSGEVELKGWVTQEEMVDYLANAALFIYLSRYEGFGFPLLHAMASGTPVISSDRSSIPEVLGEAGFQFPPDDRQAVADCVGRILTDGALWSRHSALGLRRARSFSWEGAARRHWQVIEEVLEGSEWNRISA